MPSVTQLQTSPVFNAEGHVVTEVHNISMLGCIRGPVPPKQAGVALRAKKYCAITAACQVAAGMWHLLLLCAHTLFSCALVIQTQLLTSPV